MIFLDVDCLPFLIEKYKFYIDYTNEFSIENKYLFRKIPKVTKLTFQINSILTKPMAF